VVPNGFYRSTSYPEAIHVCVHWAGFLTFSGFTAFPSAGWRTVAWVVKPIVNTIYEITVAGTAPDLHRIPFY